MEVNDLGQGGGVGVDLLDGKDLGQTVGSRLLGREGVDEGVLRGPRQAHPSKPAKSMSTTAATLNQ